MNAPEESYTRYARLTKVVDGDTVNLDIDLGHEIWKIGVPVRFEGINTPELKSPDKLVRKRAEQARDFVKASLSEAPGIKVQTNKREKYGRWLGVIWFQVEKDGPWFNLSDALIAAGLADIYQD